MRKRFRHLAILTLGLILLCTSCQQVLFDGSKSTDDSGVYLHFAMLDQTEDTVLSAHAGEEIAVELLLERGTVDIKIVSPSGEAAYTGTDLKDGSFVVVLPSEGDYTLSVTGRKAAGTVSFARVQ